MAWDEQKTRLQIFQIIRESLFAQEMREEQECGSDDRGNEDHNSEECGWNTSSTETDIEACDWNAVYAEMKEHAIAFLAQKWLENGAPKSGMDEALRNEWLRSCMRQQVRWIQIMGAQDRLLSVLAENQIECVIIKGAAVAIYYPQPSLRAMGDIDFLVKRADYERAAKVLEENGYEQEHGHNVSHHHYGYRKDGVSFELHRRLGIVQESDEATLALFEDGIARRQMVQIGTFRYPILPAELNGLVLMFHINQHLRSGLGLRQIIDWMMYLDRNDNLQELLPLFRQTGMEKLALTVTAMCREYLGLGGMSEETGEVAAREALVIDPGAYPTQELMDYIYEKGNFGTKSGEEGKIASVFLIATSPLQLFRRLQAGGLSRWKAAGKYRFLRPFAWIYQIGFILRELASYGISPRRFMRQHGTGVRQRDLIYKLGLEIDRNIN